MPNQNLKLRRAAQLALFAGIYTIAAFGTPAALQLFAGGHTVLAQQAKADRLKTVLSQMDAASTKFKSAEADIKKEHFEKILGKK